MSRKNLFGAEAHANALILLELGRWQGRYFCVRNRILQIGDLRGYCNGLKQFVDNWLLSETVAETWLVILSNSPNKLNIHPCNPNPTVCCKTARWSEGTMNRCSGSYRTVNWSSTLTSQSVITGEPTWNMSERNFNCETPDNLGTSVFLLPTYVQSTYHRAIENPKNIYY